MRAARIAGRVVASSTILGLLAGLMLHFHLASYPYLASALVGSLAIFLWSRPPAAALLFTLAAGTVFWLAYRDAMGAAGLAAFPAFMGLGSLAFLGLAAIWGAPQQRQAHIETGCTAALFPIFLVLAGLSLAVTTVAHPRTYDLFLYAFDSRLGVQPSFLAGQLLARSPALRGLCYGAYEGLPLAMALAFAIERGRTTGKSAGIVTAFAAAAAGGFLLYHLYPAVGPVHVFGSQFPFSPPPAASPPFRLAAVEAAPRNAMPSVHIAMALLIWWHSRRWPRAGRWPAAALLVLTVLATLGFGEHYLADLLVAIPFALVAQALAMPAARGNLRWASLGSGTLLVAGWLIYLRQPAPPPTDGPLPWILLVASAAGCMYLERLLYRASTASRTVNEGEYAVPRFAPG